MTAIEIERPQVEKVLSGLKDFQKDTVEYVFRRLYLDAYPTSRFLIADEVGLGKTLVARGIIAKTVDFLWDKVDRIDVIYICSNQDIARQNIDRLNITSEREFQHASRATLLPIVIDELRGRKLNFISLTPGTSFNLHSSTGQVWERVVIYNLIKKTWSMPDSILKNILRADVGKRRWQEALDWFEKSEEIDQELQEKFICALQEQTHLRSEFDELADMIGGRRKNLSSEMRVARNHFLGELRRLLAKSSLSALEPDLIILDEFQRFKYLLEEDNEFALLAQCLFDYPNAKILLLSATPYKMYTLQTEQEENHYVDFERTVKFLLNHNSSPFQDLQNSVQKFRHSMLQLSTRLESENEIKEFKSSLESILRRVMVRTERLAVSSNRNGMLSESVQGQNQINEQDLLSFVSLDQISRKLTIEDQVEYWKSSSYPFNLMEGYKLKRVFERTCNKTPELIFEDLLKSNPYLLNWKNFQEYQQIDPGNSRVRGLIENTVDTGNWKNLWLPPALPYYHPEGIFSDISANGKTKTLIFSEWRIVPKVIALLISYEVERRMIGTEKDEVAYSDLTLKRRPLLRFAVSKERLTGMPLFNLYYPCLTLANRIDPLRISLEINESERSLSRIKDSIYPLIEELLSNSLLNRQVETDSLVDERWYWASMLFMDDLYYHSDVTEWLTTESESDAWQNMLSVDDDDEMEGRFAEHVAELKNSFLNIDSLHLGKRPNDLIEVLTDIAIAGPAVSTLRSLSRVTNPGSDLLAKQAAAARVALGFRTLFNQPDATVFLQSLYPEGPYWLKTLEYCVHGNLQSVLDEYMHVLIESLGLKDHDDIGTVVYKLSNTIRQALSIRAPTLRFDEVLFDEKQKKINLEKRGVRCRYALRFGDDKDEDLLGGSRDTDVRIAFNSPFRPFILATTSIGQEGLDFHQYCHRVVHWNLPSNPVDLEQREGRIHRYKGHVIRRNLASIYGLASIEINHEDTIEPWRQMFEKAKAERPSTANDLVPYWIFNQGEYKIERIVPVFPLSREIGALKRLKKSLVIYRSVIGQPRQEELIQFLENTLPPDKITEFLNNFVIDLSPPARHNS